MRTSTFRLAVAAAAVAVIAAGCANGPDVRGDYDKAADFGRYRTYGFMSPAESDNAQYRSLVTQIMQNQAAREMEARGYTRSETPDLVINFKGKLEEKTDIESVPGPYYGPGWGYGGWYGAPYGGWYGYGGNDVTTHRYKVGTIVMDVVDREKRQAVFQGSYEGIVSKEMLQNREASISAAVQQVFAKFPFVAGQAAPVVPTVPDKK
jgi:hypothetical protein